ncbi:hypothetical protein F5141DRAFT_1065089 [Pisolithus sp. B1]|nr:hypothetical protein F5141DRAFT_1065089 [Pisolithus sp. B1]
MECLEGRQMMFWSSWGIQMTYYNTWRMFETSACKPAASMIMNGIDGPYSTLVSTSSSDGEAYFMLKETGLTLLQMCPAVRYLKHNLYNLIDEQKTVKIDSYKALLDYQLHFTKVAAHLRVMSQLLSIKKDDLFLKGLEWNDQRQYADDRWPACQVTQEAERLLEKGYCSDLRTQESRSRKAHQRCNKKSVRLGSRALQIPSSTVLEVPSLTHSLQDSSKLSKVPGGSSRGQALEVDSSKVAVAELSCSPLVEGQCKSSFECIQVNSYIPGQPLTAELQGEHLQVKWEEQNKEELLGTKPSVELKATEAMGNIPEPQSKYLHSSSSPHTDNLPQNPLNEPQEALDETRTVERPVEPAVHALEVPKPPLEPKDDLHEAPEQAGSRKVEEVEQKIKAEMRSKVVAQRKPPEKKTQRKSLKSVIWRMKDIIPGLWTAHSNGRLHGLAVLLIYLQQGWTQSLGVETCATSPSMLSQLAKRSGATTLRVNDAHSLAPHTCSDAAMKFYASLSYKSENCILEGYESYGDKVKAPHSGRWRTILESTVTSSTRKPTKKVASSVRTLQILCMKKQTPPCFEGGAQRLLYGVLHQVLRLRGWGSSRSEAQGPTWHSGQDLKCPKVFEEGNKEYSSAFTNLQQVSTRIQDIGKERRSGEDIRSSKNPSEGQEMRRVKMQL